MPLQPRRAEPLGRAWKAEEQRLPKREQVPQILPFILPAVRAPAARDFHTLYLLLPDKQISGQGLRCPRSLWHERVKEVSGGEKTGLGVFPSPEHLHCEYLYRPCISLTHRDPLPSHIRAPGPPGAASAAPAAFGGGFFELWWVELQRGKC